MSPERFFLSVRRKIKPDHITVCISVLVCGLLAHAYAFFHYLPNWDSIISYYSDQNTIRLGRCFLTLACGIGSYLDLSWVNGLLSLIYITATALVLSELFSFRKKGSLLLMSALLVTFPSVTSTFGYMYTADGYMLAMFCVSLAILLTLRKPLGFIPGAFLIMFAMGCYQAYITFAAMIVVVYALDELLHRDTPLKSLFIRLLRCIFCAGIGYTLYYIALHILLALQHTSLADYQGIREGSAIRSLSLFGAFRQCLIDFAYFFTGSLHHMNLYSALNICMLLLLAAGTASCIIRRKLYRQAARLLCILMLAALIPFICFAVYFLTPDVSYHMLMQGSLYFLYLLPVILCDRLPDTDTPGRRTTMAYRWLCVTVLTVTVYNFILIANICYRTQETSVTRSMNELDRIARRIYSITDDPLADPAMLARCNTIAVIGTHENSTDISLNLPPDMTGFCDGYIMTHSRHYSLLLRRYYDFSFEPADNEAASSLAQTDEVRSMPCWPQDGCIRIISDTLVIKFSQPD